MSLPLFDLKGKCALVTGSTQGIGAAIALALGEAGAKVIINGRTKDRVNNCVHELRSKGIDAHGAAFDLTQTAQVKDAVAGIESEISPIHILVNNAGVVRRTPAELVEDEEWNIVIQTNLTAPFVISREVAKHMLKRKAGKIINICSLMSELGRDTVAAYAAAKGGLKMLTRNLATEWGSQNIQVNAIGPGFIATPINTSYREPGNPLNDYILSRTPAGRWGTPEDLTGTAIFLSSAASDFINGQIIYVDGGLVTSFGKPFSNANN